MMLSHITVFYYVMYIIFGPDWIRAVFDLSSVGVLSSCVVVPYMVSEHEDFWEAVDMAKKKGS